jgi:hypothetical protein
MSDLLYAAEHYLLVGRGLAAIHSLGEEAGLLPADLVLGLLDSALMELNRTSEALDGMFTYYLGLILDNLEKRGAATIVQIAQTEYKFLPLFEYEKQRHLRLHRLMSENPQTYIMFLSDVVRADDENATEPTEEQRKRAAAAYQVLRTFNIVPGVQGETVETDRLRSRVLEVRRLGEKRNARQ